LREKLNTDAGLEAVISQLKNSDEALRAGRSEPRNMNLLFHGLREPARANWPGTWPIKSSATLSSSG
jgi:hypothetical protein